MHCFSECDLQRFLIDRLSPEEEVLVVAHLDSCDDCRRALDTLSDDDLVRQHLAAAQRDASTEQTAMDKSTSDATRMCQATLPTMATWGEEALHLPRLFGKFNLRAILGDGGFGTVYLAEDTELEREVAVKVPRLGGLSPSIRQRFIREGMAAAGLHHPNIVPLYQAGQFQDVLFLVAEYIPGQTLRQFLRENGRLNDPKLAAKILLPLAEAIEHAHQSGVVHRDVKPENVMLDARTTPDGLPFCPKLTDFGTARLMGATDTATANVVIGTIPYMAPERLSGQQEAAPATDIYSLGVLLYELLAGEPPIVGTDTVDMIQQVAAVEPLALHKRSGNVSRDLSAICARCLEKSPERRYQSASHLAMDLRRFLNNQTTAARPLGAATRLYRWSRRKPLLVMTILTITCALAFVVAGLAWHTKRLREINSELTSSRRRALELRDRAQQSELHARRLGYTSDMRLAERCWREGDYDTVREILDRYTPQPEKPDLRGVEWRFLERQVRPDAQTLTDCGSPLYCLRLSPDSNRFATAGQDGVIRIHDRVTGELIQSIASAQREVNDLDFSPGGEQLVSAGDDGSIRVWRLQTREILQRQQSLANASSSNLVEHLSVPDAHEGLAFGAKFTPDGESLVSCGADGAVRVWRNGRNVASYHDHTSRVETITVSPDGQWLASVGKDRSLVVRDLETGRMQWKWEQGKGTLSTVAFSPDSKTVAVAEVSGETKWLRLFDLASQAEVLKRQHPDGIRSTAFSNCGRQVLTTDNAGVVRIWNTQSGNQMEGADAKPQEIWRALDHRAYAAVFEPQGTSVLVAGEDGRVRRLTPREDAARPLVDRRQLSQTVGLDELAFAFHAIAFHPNNEQLIAAAHVGAVVIDLEDGALTFRNQAGHNACVQVAASPCGRWVFSAASSAQDALKNGLPVPAKIDRWQPQAEHAMQLRRTDPNCSIHALCCSPLGDRLAVVVSHQAAIDTPKKLWLLDAVTGAICHEFVAAAGTRPQFSKDGRFLYYGLQRDIHVVDLHTREHRLIPQCHDDSQSGMSVSRDGKWIATCSEGRELRVFNLATLQLHAILQGHQGTITALAFAADSQTLLSSSHDGKVKAWSVSTGQHLMDIHQGAQGVSDMALSDDGSRMAIVEAEDKILLYSLKEGQ